MCPCCLTLYRHCLVFAHLVQKYSRHAAAYAQHMVAASASEGSQKCSSKQHKPFWQHRAQRLASAWLMYVSASVSVFVFMSVSPAEAGLEVLTLMSSGVSLLLRSFLCTHRKLISTMLLVLPRIQTVAGTAAPPKWNCSRLVSKQARQTSQHGSRHKAQDEMHHPEISLIKYMCCTYCLLKHVRTCAPAKDRCSSGEESGKQSLHSRLPPSCSCCISKRRCTCDEADQLVVALDSDTNVPLRYVTWRLQRPLQKVMCVLESALRHTVVVQTAGSKTQKWHKQLLHD